MVILEAASAGLPVVTSDIEVFREFLDHDTNAIMTRVADSGSLAAGMARLIDEPATAKRLAENGPSLAAGYPWSATAAQHIEMYNSIMSSDQVLHDINHQ